MRAGYVKKGFDRQRYISSVMEHVSVWYLGVGQVFPELLVLVSGNFSLLTRPDSSNRVDYLPVKLDGETDELREFLDCFINQLLLRKLTARR
jgi:hypothetical protein